MKPAPFRNWWRSRLAVHVYGWLALFLSMLADGSFDKAHLLSAVTYIGLALPPVYGHFYVLEQFLRRRRSGRYLGLAALIVVGCGWLDTAAFRALGHSMVSLTASIATVLFLIVLTTALKFAARGIRRDMRLQELEAKQAQSELALLRHQIHPHFLFNTLNNLFASARKQDDSRTADGIARLARLMRYLLEEAQAETVELAKEAEQIGAFLELQRLRYSPTDDVRIELRVSGAVDTVRVAPMLLIPFVENACKHSASLVQRTVIDVALSADNGSLLFTVANTVNRHSVTATDSPGIGLANVKRRLELLYPRAHRLTIDDTGDAYRVELRLDTR